jgi:hypothetical protein
MDLEILQDRWEACDKGDKGGTMTLCLTNKMFSNLIHYKLRAELKTHLVVMCLEQSKKLALYLAAY